ncbi:MAG: hypothetical protein AAF502_14005 [Bacteroidota bacterium]
MAYSLEQIKDVLQKKGYEFFDGNKKYNLNIIGVRTDNNVPNSFDDNIYLIYRDDDLKMKVDNFPVTTDPGLHWLLHPLNVKGTAILVPGQYRGSHKIRKHQGKYDAVCQQGNLTVWRDNNKDKILDFENAPTQTGSAFGINIHRSNPSTESTVVHKWSAGCTVFKRVKDFLHLMRLAYKARTLYSNSFTYTLLTEKDFKGMTGNQPETHDPVVEQKAKSDKEKKAMKELEELNAEFMSILKELNDKKLADFLLTERQGIEDAVEMLLNDLRKCDDSSEKTALIEELEKEKRMLKMAIDWYKKKLRTISELPPTDEIIEYLRKKNQARHNRLEVINRKIAALELAQNS